MTRQHTTTPTDTPSITKRFSVIFLPLALFVLLLLFYGYHTFQTLQLSRFDTPGNLFVLSPAGEPAGDGSRFQELHPEAWDYISARDAGQYTNAHGIFTFDTQSISAYAKTETLKVLSFIPAETVQAETRKILFRVFALASVSLVLLAFGAWNVARSQISRELAAAELLDAHNELKSKNTQLAHLNSSKDKFFSILAQDLQTPVTRALELVRFTAENLDFFGKEEYKETTETLLSSLENLRELLKNLFTWSGTQRGTLTAHLQTVDLGSIVKRNTSLLLPTAEDKQIIFKNSVPEETFIYADPNMVYAIVRNVISNALKFSFPDDNVTISALRHEHELDLIISDSGVGIDAENIPKLFRDDVSYQTPGTSGEEGAGLGLLLCKKLIDENGGSIRVESEVGRGTTVTCRFPCKAV